MVYYVKWFRYPYVSQSEVILDHLSGDLNHLSDDPALSESHVEFEG